MKAKQITQDSIFGLFTKPWGTLEETQCVQDSIKQTKKNEFITYI